MALIKFKEFRNKTIATDGEEYETCSFNECRLTFAGGEPPRFYDCVFINCDIDVIGPALRTVGFLTALWISGLTVPVEDIFNSIMSQKQFPERPFN
jgi:hypothetical protein